MLRFRDVLTEEDRLHLRTILGETEDPTVEATKRRLRVSRIATDDTYLAEDALESFQALAQPARERLISDVVWRLTCHMEGSITRHPGVHSVALECGFRMVQSEQEGRDVFCVVKGR